VSSGRINIPSRNAFICLSLTSDSISDTVDYGAIAELVVEEIEGDRVILIEKLAGKIGDRVLALDTKIMKVEIKNIVFI
jgi:dihydroneopterin aldolase